MRHLSNSREPAAATKRERRFYLANISNSQFSFLLLLLLPFSCFLFRDAISPPPVHSVTWRRSPLFPLLCDVYPQFFFSLYTRSPQPTFWLWLWTKKAKHVKNWCPFTCRLTIPRKFKYRTPSVVVANKKKGCTWTVPPFLFDSFILSL